MSIAPITKDSIQIASDENNPSDRANEIEKIASGFEFVEGPLWHPDGFLLFSDIPADTIYQWSPDRPVRIFRQPSGRANGNAFDREGRLITAEHKTRRLSRTLDTGEIITLVERYQNKRLNSPNDLAIKSDGSIYFTDPPYGIKPDEEELGFSGVYRLSADGTITLLTKEFERPNGIIFSPDETKLYVNDSRQGLIRVFAVKSDGTLGRSRVFARFHDNGKEGVPDGMAIDRQGNVYSTGPGGVWVFSPSGQWLGTLPVPEVPSNVTWGDRDNNTLYITARHSIYRIRFTGDRAKKTPQRGSQGGNHQGASTIPLSRERRSRSGKLPQKFEDVQWQSITTVISDSPNHLDRNQDCPGCC
ncbi:SMP-30/gluconolactonase/LRE family protein [Roseofilum casamattae]|uniref:SMP-30/gluconolactonase/LRE family protein n=1 Tax=Roseofilum casamattae BLCC-M143 TaxID=3022442 RepID=A0ABT7C0I9_9CYAN|nr:SMP-30/gluconolactonase/LRE family protein [Roseofilum casamattae]MDJ1184965.1 SMP-30/gluconolactonase/LRE family protein [Roseofilum casamattae BLCC-M143]